MYSQPTVENVPHKITPMIENVLANNTNLKQIWDTLTPLAQNEWICWITSFKQEKTRNEHLRRFSQDLLKGKRRPCCWPGCPHRPNHPKKTYTSQKKRSHKM